jgi:hypothetical protein
MVVWFQKGAKRHMKRLVVAFLVCMSLYAQAQTCSHTLNFIPAGVAGVSVYRNGVLLATPLDYSVSAQRTVTLNWWNASDAFTFLYARSVATTIPGTNNTIQIPTPYKETGTCTGSNPAPAGMGTQVAQDQETVTTGPPGPAGLTWMGIWTSTTQYSAGAAVSYSGSSFVAIQPNMGVEPPTGVTTWQLLAQAGNIPVPQISSSLSPATSLSNAQYTPASGATPAVMTLTASGAEGTLTCTLTGTAVPATTLQITCLYNGTTQISYPLTFVPNMSWTFNWRIGGLSATALIVMPSSGTGLTIQASAPSGVTSGTF